MMQAQRFDGGGIELSDAAESTDDKGQGNGVPVAVGIGRFVERGIGAERAIGGSSSVRRIVMPVPDCA